MYKNYKIVVVTPSGRKQYQSILYNYIKRNFDIIDEYRIWLNTKNETDISWLKSIKNNKVTIDSRKGVDDIKTICQYFDNCIDHDTIYIRLDDDIVYLEKFFFQKLIDFRINNPDFLFVSANIVNNYHCFHIQKKLKIINFLDDIGGDPKQAEKLHNYFIDLIYKNKIETMFFDKEVANKYEQININAICWFGKQLNKNYKIIKNRRMYKKSLVQFICENEEVNINTVLPKITKKYNCVCGNAVCCHFSFRQQINYLKNTDLLKKYQNLIFKIY